jgi:hypothetical protein
MKWIFFKKLNNFFKLDTREKKDFPPRGDKIVVPTMFPKEKETTS